MHPVTALLLLQVAAGNQATQDPAPADSALMHAGGRVASVVVAVRADAPPSLDGSLDDDVWQAADPVTGFRRDRPSDGQPASERTEVRVAYTNTALYVGARMYDRTPSLISRLRGRRDSFGQQNDQFWVQIDSYHDHRTAFIFGVTPAGGRSDVIAPNDRLEGMDTGWDPVWEVATTVDSLGWTAEFRIPFSQLRFPEADRQIWGINFRRDILHAGEAADWNWTPGTEAGWTSHFGHLVGLEGIPRPGRLEILPYAVAQGAFDQRADPGSPFDDGSLFDRSVGVDLKYGLTSGLTLDGTINPDFGQVEADPAVVNLTAFETFFEERRPFFVEGANIFDFGGLQSLRFFYSRRIG
ncbi:MAG: carbohydrate binding family 9 domain-containing protein, partial [Gemmatimonadetes bacterium]|nr:carbohydrate binding family 9 domain-containing protein [Gemmatimonadota bacterium]